MNTTVRNLVLVGTTVATVAVGVFVSRALQDEESPAAIGDHDSPVLVDGDIGAADDLAMPILAPVAITDDPAMLDRLLEGPDVISDDTPGPEIGSSGGGGGVTGGVVGPVIPDDGFAGLEAEDPEAPAPDPLSLPFLFDPVIGLLPFPELAFDVCAGLEPGTPPSPACPEGYAGTLIADHIAPAPFLYGSVGHYLSDPTGSGFATCPASTTAAGPGQTAITVFSQTPLDGLVVDWRQYGSSHEWQSLVVDPATPADERAAWFARFESEPFSREAFYLSRCIVIDRDPNIAYEVRLIGVDAFLRVVNGQPMTLPDATPQGRPPTEASVVGVQPFANVTGWTKPGGSVSFSTRVITDLAGGGDCSDSLGEEVPSEGVHSLDGQLASPVGVYDPAFTRKVFTRVPLPPAGLVLLCATVYDSGNRLRPLGTDSVLLHAPTAQRPLITLEGFRLNSGITVAMGTLAALIQFPGERELVGDGCGQVWANTAGDLTGSVAVNAPLWTCEEAPLPVDSTGYVKVPVTISRWVNVTRSHSERRTESWGIQIQVDRCDPVCPPRPTEWFEIPVPTAGGVLCGRNFWESDDSCPQPTDGVAIIKVEYPVIDAAPGRYGTATLIASSDRSVVDPTEGEPIMYQDSTVISSIGDWNALPAAMTIFSDRPVTINSLQFADAIGDATPECRDRDLAVGGEPATEFHVEFTMCAGTWLTATATVTDAAGVVYERYLGLAYGPPDVIAPSVHTTVEFLGGDVPHFGWIYRFGVELDYQTPTYYGLYNWSGDLGPDGRSCFSLDNAVADGPHGPQIRVNGGQLEVQVSVTITAADEADCGRGRGGTYSGTTEFSGTFTLTQLQSGEPLTLTTPPDAALQMRLTIDADWRLVPTV